jgi:cleavage and polyadenylation specificity factor subunit 1
VIASSLIKCSDNYIFIGSRLGNSVLLKYSVKIVGTHPEKRKLDDLEKSESTKEANDDQLNDEVLDNVNKIKSEQFDSFSPNLTTTITTTTTNAAELDDLDIILEMNQEKSLNVTDVPSYNFEICDILLNVAPCGHSIVGESVGDYSEFETKNSLQVDLVTSSGHTKNGAISVLQRSIRPEVISTFQIPDVIDMWSVFNDSGSDSTLVSHTYLFLSKVDSTMILQMANEITELDRDTSVFCTKYPTMCCSNLCNNKYIIQITSHCAYVYSECTVENNGKLFCSCDLTLNLDSKMKRVSVMDPYAVILTDKGSILLLKFDAFSKTLKLIDTKTMFKYDQNQCYLNAINCFTVFKDESKIFDYNFSANSKNNYSPDHMERETKYEPKAETELKTEQTLQQQIEIIIDDEDELLYGSGTTNESNNTNAHHDQTSDCISKLLNVSNVGASSSSSSKVGVNSQKKPEEPTNFSKTLVKNKTVTFWLLTVTFEGSLALINLKDEEINLIYTVAKFCSAPKTLILFNQFKSDQMNDNDDNDHHRHQDNALVNPVIQQVPLTTTKPSSLLNIENPLVPNVHELLMISVGHEKCRSLLIARIEEDLIVYEAFLANEASAASSGDQVNFKRLNHEIIIRDRKKRKIQNRKILNADLLTAGTSGESQEAAANSYLLKRTRHAPCLSKFESIAGFSGFCVTGFHPYLVFFCPRSGLTAHPMWIDGSVSGFVGLKNAAITMSGFVYFNKSFDIRICTLPVEEPNSRLQIYYDSPWILKKIQTRHTIHFLCYHEESKTYAVVSSVTEPTNKLIQLGGEDKDQDVHERDENFILPNKSQFFIQLYTTNGWDVLPLGKYELAEWEHVSCLKLVSLPYEGHSSGFRSYIAASTINCYNEDVNSRGRVLIFDVIEVEPEPDKPLTSIKMKTILEKEQKGPVTCLESINGYLLGGVGQKIYIWEYKNNELLGKAFIDTHFFVHRMVTLKNFVLIADLHKSISLIRFQPEYTNFRWSPKTNKS